MPDAIIVYVIDQLRLWGAGGLVVLGLVGALIWQARVYKARIDDLITQRDGAQAGEDHWISGSYQTLREGTRQAAESSAELNKSIERIADLTRYLQGKGR